MEEQERLAEEGGGKRKKLSKADVVSPLFVYLKRMRRLGKERKGELTSFSLWCWFGVDAESIQGEEGR